MPVNKDPDGTAQHVNKEHRALTFSITEDEALHVNDDEGEAYSVLVDITPATTDDDFFYLKNKSIKDLVIYEIEGWCADANQEIKILIGATDAGTNAGDTLTPINMRSISGGSADVDCAQDATDLAISGGNVVSLLKFPTTALELATFTFSAGIIITQNQRLHMEAALAGLINLNIYFYFHDKYSAIRQSETTAFL